MQVPGVQVDLGNLTLNGEQDAGLGYLLENVEGWDGAETVTSSTQRAGDHGTWAGPVWLGERVLTLTGSVAAASPAGLEQAIMRLLTACSLTPTTLTVWETVPRQCTVRRSGKPLVARSGPYDANFSLLVTAADPRQYAVEETTAMLRLPSVTGGLAFPITYPITYDATVVVGDATVTNEGDFETRPLITIAGPVSQPMVSMTGPDGTVQQLLYSGDIDAGDWVDLDTDMHTAYYNGTASRRGLVTGTWPVLAPGQSEVAFRAGAPSSTATCTVRYRSAWM